MAFNNILPNRYRKNNKSYLMKIPDSFPVSFFINSTPIASPAFTSLKLALLDAYGVINNDLATLSKVDVTGGYRIYIENLSLSGLVDGKQYELRIYDSVIGGDPVLYSVMCFEFRSSADGLVQVSYRNSSNIFNYNYVELPDYRNIFYLDLALIDEQAEYEIDSYFEVSTGDARMIKSQIKDYIVLESKLFDSQRHDGMKALSLHDDIILNQRTYSVKEGYSIDYNIRSKRADGTIEFWDQGKNEINLKNGQPEV